MAQDPSEIRYTVKIVGVRSEDHRKRAAQALAKIAKNLTMDQVWKKMQGLPWTLTRSANEKRALNLRKMLQSSGAVVEISPPLEVEGATVAPETLVTDRVEAEPSRKADSVNLTHVADIPAELKAEPIGPGLPAPKPERPSPAEPAEDDIGQFDLEPLGLGGILDRTFHICKSHFWKLLGILAIPWLATAIIVAGTGLLAVILGFAGSQAFGKGVSLWALIGLGIVVVPAIVVVLVAIFYLAQGALIHAVALIYLGKRVEVKQAYRFVMGRLWRFVFTSLLAALAMMGAMIIPVAIGVVLFLLSELIFGSGWWSAITWIPLAVIPTYALPKIMLFDKAVIIEDVAYVEALKRSWYLVDGKAEGPWPRSYWLRIVILFHIFIFINMGVYMLFGLPAAVVALLMPESFGVAGQIISEVVKQVGGLVSGLFASVCLVVYYYDIRVRKEGFDLKMLAGMHEPME